MCGLQGVSQGSHGPSIESTQFSATNVSSPEVWYISCLQRSQMFALKFTPAQMFTLVNLFAGLFPENECKNGAGTQGGSNGQWFISSPWVNQKHTDTVWDLTSRDWKTCRNQVMEMVEEILSFIVSVLLMSLLCPFYPLSHPRLPEGKL